MERLFVVLPPPPPPPPPPPVMEPTVDLSGLPHERPVTKSKYFSLLCTRSGCWTNNRAFDDLGRPSDAVRIQEFFYQINQWEQINTKVIVLASFHPSLNPFIVHHALCVLTLHVSFYCFFMFCSVLWLMRNILTHWFDLTFIILIKLIVNEIG